MRGRLIGRDALLRGIVAHTRGAGGVNGLVLTGPAGVGKSRLLDELLEHRMLRPWVRHRFVGTEPGRSVAFGSLFSLLPDTAPSDRAQLLRRLRSALLDGAAGRRILVAVDDAHLLDEQSSAFLAELAQRRDAALAMTLRSGHTLPSPLMGLVRAATVERVAVEPLDGAGILELAEEVLGGPVAPELAGAVAGLSGGLPLLAREILLDARTSGAIDTVGPAWEPVRPLRPGPRVQELVLDRIASLPAPARRVLELVALADPLDVAVLDDEEGAHLDHLEAVHLVELRQAARGLWASVEHPLFGEALTAVLPTRRRVELLRDLVDRTRVRGRRRRGDALRAAGWLLATGVRPDADLAAAAADDALAGFDLELAARLAVDALAEGDRGDALAILADVRRLQGRTDEAVDAARRGLDLADDDVHRARCAEVLALVLTHQRGDAAGAVALLRRTAGTLRDPPLTVRLQQLADHLEGVLGAYPEVLASARATVAGDLDDAEMFAELQNLAYVQVMLGRLLDVDEAIERALQLGEEIGAGPEMIDLTWALRAGVHVQRGTFDEGEHAIGEHLRRCRGDGHPHITAATIHLQLLAHRGSDALFALGQQVLDGEAGHDMFGVRPIVLGTLAWAHARCGRVAEAEALLAQVPDDLDDERTLPFVGAGRAALLAATGDGDGAADVSERTGRRAMESTHVAFGVVALHAAVGHGRHATLAELLAQATADVDGALLRAMSQHAAAVRDGAAEALEDVATDFARMGACPHAAQAYAEAASVTAPATAAARRAAARAQLWSEAAAPFRSRVPDVDDALSGRELEVAWRAATGAASRKIAEELYLSVRTVDNHLRSAYRKLDVGGRPGLAEALRPLPPPPTCS